MTTNPRVGILGFSAAGGPAADTAGPYLADLRALFARSW
jgi:hypothetical protein